MSGMEDLQKLELIGMHAGCEEWERREYSL